MREILLFAATLAMAATLLVAGRNARTVELSLTAQRDSLDTRVRAVEAEADSTLWPGDSLPDAELLTDNGASRSLRSVAKQYRYLYFFRDDCPTCSLIAPIWVEPGGGAEKIAHIAYDSRRQQSAPSGPNGFAWQVDSGATFLRRVRVTPTLIVTNEDGLVVSNFSGYKQILSATKGLEILNPPFVDSAFDRSWRLRTFARASRPR